MKKIYFLLFFFCVSFAYAQTQLPEGGFNNWTISSTGEYEEPSGNFWTTLNSLKLLGGPVTVRKSTDFHLGTFAARLETKQWGSFLLPGLLVSGSFETEAPFIIQGKPFTEKPMKFKGWYKYTSVNNDSAAIVTLLTKYNNASNKRDTIALAVLKVKNTVSSYTPFDINIDYTQNGVNPDSITVVFSSSANGENFQGQVGSILWVDDVSLEYSTGVQESLLPEFGINIFPSPANQTININCSDSLPSRERSCYSPLCIRTINTYCSCSTRYVCCS